MFFWHVGPSIAFTRYAFRDEGMDLRFLALGAVLPNLIDLPIGAALWSVWQTPRLSSHSLAISAIVMVAVLLFTRRGPIRKRWMLVAIGMLLHLVLDAMWAEPNTLWWPFLGWDFSPTSFSSFSEYAVSVLQDPWMWAGELAGLVYLGYLWTASGLGESAARSKLISTGRVSAPIGRS